jgi:hypothetical protein
MRERRDTFEAKSRERKNDHNISAMSKFPWPLLNHRFAKVKEFLDFTVLKYASSIDEKLIFFSISLNVMTNYSF